MRWNSATMRMMVWHSSSPLLRNGVNVLLFLFRVCVSLSLCVFLILCFSTDFHVVVRSTEEWTFTGGKRLSSYFYSLSKDLKWKHCDRTEKRGKRILVFAFYDSWRLRCEWANFRNRATAMLMLCLLVLYHRIGYINFRFASLYV